MIEHGNNKLKVIYKLNGDKYDMVLNHQQGLVDHLMKGFWVVIDPDNNHPEWVVDPEAGHTYYFIPPHKIEHMILESE
jgi:hypothetical protein